MSTNNLGTHSGKTYTTANWREAVRDLQAVKVEQANVRAYPDTPRYLLDQLDKEINRTVESLWPVITQGAIGEFEASIQNFKKSKTAVSQSVAREISRWDPNALLSQMGVYQARVNQIVEAGGNILDGGPTVADRLQALYQEARDSDSEIHQRAAGEVFQTVLTRVGNVDTSTRLAANHLQKTAQKDLDALRVTDELQTAREGQEVAKQKMLIAREDLAVAGEVLGKDPREFWATGDIARAYKRVGVDANDQLVIYEPDNPEVTGIDWMARANKAGG